MALNHTPPWKQNAYLFFLVIIGCCSGCHEGGPGSSQTDSAAIRRAHAESPVLSPGESLKHFVIEKGFDITLVAAEPMVQAPVSMSFDVQGRIWVVEMQGYMPDTAGTGETTRPAGDIVILEDTDHDGVPDKRRVFMDSLVLPRAICFYGDGLLIAEPPRLWFVEINHDQAGKKYIVDSDYAVGGNVEHQPNGLLRGIDNWIYSANSTKSYRMINGRWVIRRTHFRGQWGITRDVYGRLLYNNNSANLLGDFFLPGLGAGNPDQRYISGFNENIVPDNRTYPIHPTPGVNRGYVKGTLDDSLRLINFTAASGPAIYDGGLFGAGYEGNVFVGGPAANLVKRNVLQQTGYRIEGRQAYQGKEFLASDDERFRPVSLYTGPDGALYIVDMYRGILQDVIYLTPYLKNEISMRRLSHPLNRGRIYKVLPKGIRASLPDLSATPADSLVDLLDSPNGQIRGTAQRLLTDGHMRGATDLLRRKLTEDTFAVGKIHAFWTLEGLGRLRPGDIREFLHTGDVRLEQQAIAAIVSGMDPGNARSWLGTARSLSRKRADQLAPYLAFLAASAVKYAPSGAFDLLQQLAWDDKNDPFVADAVISGLYQKEDAFLKQFKKMHSDTSSVFYRHLTDVLSFAKNRKASIRRRKLKAQFSKGQQLFETFCEACHGADGNGIRSLGAPLNGSQWVTGEKGRLLAIVLCGLSGPVKVGDKTYRKPEVGGEMPAFGQNDQLSDLELSQILSFVRNAWGNQADTLGELEVRQARELHKKRQKPFTQEELE